MTSSEYSIPVFENPEELGIAGEHLLRSSVDIPAVVVRGIGTRVLHEAAISGFYDRDATIRDELYKSGWVCPLDDIVREWSQAELGDYYKLANGNLHINTVRTSGIIPHYDSNFPLGRLFGPITMSIRTDANTSKSRDFFVYPPIQQSVLRKDSSEIRAEVHDELDRQVSDLVDCDVYDTMIHIEQHPGDAILFRGYPHPTIHAVGEYQDPEVHALVATYHIGSLM